MVTVGGMSQRSFLILHGLEGSGPGHWQTWLADRLRAGGERVAFPMLPEADHPRLDEWLRELGRHLQDSAPRAGRTVVCHSLGCLLWLHHARTATPEAGAARVLLVAPPCQSSGIAEIDDFFPVPLSPVAVAGAASQTRLVCAANDPYCPEGALRRYGNPLGLTVDLIADAGHLSGDDGYGPWPAVEDWCLDGGGLV